MGKKDKSNKNITTWKEQNHENNERKEKVHQRKKNRIKKML